MSGIIMEELFKLITNYGFPIVIAVYLLVRMEKIIGEIKDSILGKDGILDKIEDVLKLLESKK